MEEDGRPRVAATRRLADEWALVLVAEGLSPTVVRERGGFALRLPAHQEERAEEILAAFLPPHDLSLILEIIRGHNQRGLPNPYPVPVQIVQDADILDHQGPQGVWLQLWWNATHGPASTASGSDWWSWDTRC